MIVAPPSNGSLTPLSRVVRATMLVLPLLFVSQATYAAAKPKPKKSHSTPHAKSTQKLLKTKRRPSRASVAAPDISPERGTSAAESVQATLAESPANPFLYSRNLDSFFHALAAQQNPAASPDDPATTIRILQFGDSHTAADYYTGAVREQLQSRFGNGGLGYQYPGHPFAGYRLAGSSRGQSSGWTTDGNHFTHLGDGYVGLGGLSIETSRPNESVTLSTTCTTLQVHYLRQSGGGHLRFTDNGTFISDLDTSAEADPLTPSAGTPSAGTMTYACTPGVHDFELTTLDHAPVRLLGLVTEQPGITYECLGINGAYAPLMLQWNQKLFEDYLRQRNPNLIVLAYGTNEAAQSAAHNADYVYDFNRLLQNLHRIVPTASILVLGPYDRAMKTGRGRRATWHTFAGTDRIIADQKESCRQYHCAFYDQRARQGGPGAAIRWVSAGYGQPDRTHLTGTGYRALAQAFYLDLLAAFKRYQTEPEPTR